MPAAYYDIIADEGATFRLKLKFMDTNKKSIDLLNPPVSVIDGFEDKFPKDSNDKVLPFKAYVRMQVRDSVDGDLIPADLNDLTNCQDSSLWGQSNLTYPNNKITLTERIID
jgi:hypothetical protein